jgi:CoA:oxalate CoA-transferase
MAALDQWASTRSAAECEATLNAGGVPCSRYHTVAEAQAHDQFQARDSFATIDDGAGPLKVPNPAFKLLNAVARARDYVPGLGADNDGIISKILGYSREQIAELYDRRILHGGRNQTRGEIVN